MIVICLEVQFFKFCPTTVTSPYDLNIAKQNISNETIETHTLMNEIY